MTPPLGDVVARARGLATHLLSDAALEQLADAPGSAALADQLAGLGYAAPPLSGAAAMSSAEAVQAAIEREGARRLGVLASWLGARRSLFVCVFEDEERRVLRSLLRRAVSEGRSSAPPARSDALLSLPRRVRQQLERSGDAPGFVRVLQRAGSPYAGPLASVLRERGPDLVALETALDRTFAARARAAAQRGGRLLAGWVAEGIDLENSWGVLLGAPGGFLEGGRQLSSAQCDLIQREPDAVARRARLADVFAGGPLARLFGDEDAPPATLERRARDARAAACARAARIEPLGVLALLAVVLRLRDEAARLRRIGWAVAQGVPDPYASGPAWGAS